jgi:hypothetical protein
MSTGEAHFSPFRRTIAIAEEAAHLLVADRHIGRDHAEAAGAIALERLLRGVRAHGDLDAGARLHPLLESPASFEAIPEGLGRHAHDQVIGLAGHDLVDGAHHLAADIVHQRIEIVVVADGIVGDVDAAEMVGYAARAHGLEFRLHGSVGRGRNDGELLAKTEGVSHGATLPQVAAQANCTAAPVSRVYPCRADMLNS